MARVLCISSFVARGHVGLAAILPALNGLGHETIALPTIVLSNHPGHPRFSKLEVPATTLIDVIGVYEHAGWLKDIDCVLTGYLPSVVHVAAAVNAIAKIREVNPAVLVVCDPVLGDDPYGLYIPHAAATALRDGLLPFANIITPNRYELAWLSGLPVSTSQDAVAAAKTLRAPMALITSLPSGPVAVGNLLVQADQEWLRTVPLLQSVPHGTGDFMGALFTGHLLTGCGPEKALGLTVAGVHAVAQRSQGRDELLVVADSAAWIHPAALEP